MASDLLATIRGEIEARLDELRPLLSEYERLLAATDALAVPEAPVTAAFTPTPALIPAALGDPVAESHPDELAERVAPGEAAAWADPDAGPEQIVHREALVPASSGDGSAVGPSGEGDMETIADVPESRWLGYGLRGSAAGAIEQAASGAIPLDDDHRPKRVDSASVQQAILAALGHGSHTLSELVTVTAMTTADIRGGLRPLAARRAITKTKRDGKTAYALSRASAETAA
jgi:hypothetical protein